ncbi:putative histone H3.1/H3.2 [Clavispora lusitaniae]|uniref:Histone H3.1/H3.2 n=1 Tax=Clavispora lusitaniae TaxID=36911 RepID=A0ACD0WP77_CLALS|nr:putative histone H3.1/H3.2 [Clavispora lusitaniae]QFZ35005.1 putative histone H3.1/H3.2 [Clavispora lusitaniae]QFZ40690.1 putative histone H3.1/H3.2 [Clavispora lusitaniae]QFZ46370.1 putative histone H3.1/H3.2 [Clavispora lusitaniae]QFZ52032.1 putative histone H3.1/H3.2 [Clavispora lusitaniae]
MSRFNPSEFDSPAGNSDTPNTDPPPVATSNCATAIALRLSETSFCRRIQSTGGGHKGPNGGTELFVHWSHAALSRFGRCHYLRGTWAFGPQVM